MHAPPQAAPVMRYARRPTPTDGRGLRPSDCPDGTLSVTAPDNPVPYTFSDVVGCCYSYPNCNPCFGNDHYKGFVQQHVAACAGDSYNSCFVKQTC